MHSVAIAISRVKLAQPTTLSYFLSLDSITSVQQVRLESSFQLLITTPEWILWADRSHKFRNMFEIFVQQQRGLRDW